MKIVAKICSHPGIIFFFSLIFPIFFSFMLNMSLVMISENVKLAREYALLGNYDSAMVYYQGVLDQMNKYLYSVRDTYLQQKWQQVNSTSLGHFMGKALKWQKLPILW